MEIRPVTLDEHPDFVRTFFRAMSFPPPEDAAIERMQADFRPERSLAAFDRDQIVGSADSYLFELTIPGGSQIDVAGVTRVGVLPTHRRRGLLTRLMTRQLTEARDRGEPVAVLIASESVIYGRFGYGVSSHLVDIEVDTRYRELHRGIEPTGAVSFVDEETADKVFPEVHERWRKQQPGAIPRTDAWWAGGRADRKPGHDAHLIHEDDSGNVDGYVRYRVNSKWDAGLAASTLDEQDLICITPEASLALWKHMLEVDLVRTVRVQARPVDEPIRWWIANPRALKVTRFGDFFWTRLLDIPASLTARRYRADAELVVHVDDFLFDDNTGGYALTIANGAGRCERTGAKPDLEMSVADLGSLYLGGVTASDIARSGRIRELTEGALEKADAAFSSAPKPWSATWF
ncbi:MAG TPA: GNAT family N-acetyltransferase [Actinomycetota bacterium]|jgi:predicted acetyltransferase|nr:GNAT family N-acetyltransferase [Actinomycetota bacterium]